MEVDFVLAVGIVSILIALFLTVLAYLTYSGLFFDIEIKASKPPFGTLTVAYKFARGPYKNCGQLFTEVHNLVPELKCIGVYYDDPEEVDSNNLRYLVGAIINDEQTTFNQEFKEKLLRQGFQTASFPSVDHVVMTTFPFKGTLSVMIAIARVYPKLRQYLKERKLCAHPVMEIYNKEEIIFLAPLAKQDEFYVSEALEESEEETPSNQVQSDSDISKITEIEGEKEKILDERESIPPPFSGSSCSNSVEFISHVDVPEENGNSKTNGSDRSTASSFEELQMDS